MKRIATRLLPLLLGALALQACATDSDGPKARKEAAITPTEQFPIAVRQDPDEVRLAIHDRGMSEGQQAALVALVDRWRDRGGGTVTVQAPRGPGVDAASGAYADAAAHALVDLGVPIDRVRLVGYDAPPGKGAPLIVGFASYAAQGPQCGKWDSLSKTAANKPYENFGCSMSANFAAQIANARDLTTPRDMTPADASRRSVVLDKYRKGETTSTAQDVQATASTKSSGGGGG